MSAIDALAAKAAKRVWLLDWSEAVPSDRGTELRVASHHIIAAAIRKALQEPLAALKEAEITLEALRDNGWLNDKRAVGPECTRVAKQCSATLAKWCEK